MLKLADRAGLRSLAHHHLSVPTDKGANAEMKVASVVAGMVAGTWGRSSDPSPLVMSASSTRSRPGS